MTQRQSVTLLILSCLVVYSGTLYHGFHFDDTITIVYPPRIRDLENFFAPLMEWSIRPLLLLTFKVNYAIGRFNPVGYHAVNIGLHCLNSWLVYSCVILLGVKPLSALIAALFFAVHPLQTQSVTYLSCRSVLLATTFYLSSVALVIPEISASSKGFRPLRWIAPIGLGLLGFLVKEIMISWPAVLVAIWCANPSFSSNLKIKVVGSAMAVFGLLAWWRVATFGAILPTSQTPYTIWQYFVTELHVIPYYYLAKVLMPWGLSVDPFFPIFDRVTPIILVFLMFVLVAIWKAPRISRLGIVIFILTIGPESSFVPLLDVVAEHRMYLPMFGLALAISPFIERIHPYAVVTGLVVLAILSIERNKVWATEFSLWTDARDKAPQLIRPHNNLGHAYDQKGDSITALYEFNKCLELNPEYTLALVNVGNIYGKLGNLDLAEQYFLQAVALDARMGEAWYNLATVYFKRNKYAEAMANYEKAMDLSPNLHESWKHAAAVARILGETEKAESYGKRYRNLNPWDSK